MSNSARRSLTNLIAALEYHFELAQNADVVQPALLEAAEDRLRDAFFTYDDVLFTQFDTELPFEILDDDLEEEEEDSEDSEEDVSGDDRLDNGVDVDVIWE